MNQNPTRTFLTFVLTGLMVMTLALPGAPGAPRAVALTDPCALDPNNLFYNGTMAPGHTTSYGLVADGWAPFIYAGAPPQYNVVDNEKIDPHWSQQIFGVNAFDAGVQQTVPGLQIGVNYWFRLGYSLAAKSYDGPNVRVNTIGRQVGVDPYGGADPHSSNVLWGPTLWDGNVAVNRPEMVFVFTARATSATIFLRAIATDGSGGENRVWFDALCMEARPDLPPTTPPASTFHKVYLPAVYSSNTTCTPTNLATISVGVHPKGVAADPTTQRVFVSLFDDSQVAVVDAAANQKTATWGTNSTGHSNGIGVTSGKVFVALRDAAGIAVLDAVNGGFIVTRTVGLLPYGVGGAGNRVWVANFGSDSVSLLDATTASVMATTGGGGSPALVAAAGNRAFVSLWGSGVAEVADDGAVLHNFTSPEAGAFGVAFDAAANRLYVSNRLTRKILLLDPSTGAVVKSVTLPPTQAPYALAINPSTHRLFVVLAEANQVDVRDGATLERIALLAVGAQGDDGGDGIAVMNGRVYVANNAAGTLSVIEDVCP